MSNDISVCKFPSVCNAVSGPLLGPVLIYFSLSIIFFPAADEAFISTPDKDSFDVKIENFSDTAISNVLLVEHIILLKRA